MNDFMSDVATVRLGAACSAARPTWTNVVAAGADHALGQSLVLAAGRPEERRAAFWLALAQQATEQATQQMTPQATQRTRTAVLAGSELLSTTVTATRKPNFVYKTHINAGGYGAMGPYPEREQLA